MMRTQRFMASLCLTLLLAVGTSRPAAAQDKEPTYRGRTASQWAMRVGIAPTRRGFDSDFEVAERAVRAITKMGPEAKSAAPTLINIIRMYAFGYADVRERCKPAMAALKGIGPEAVPALREALKGGAKPGDFNRINFISTVSQVLGEIGPGAKAAIPDLIANLKDKELSFAAGEALRKIGPAALPAVVEALKDKESLQGARSALLEYVREDWEIGADAKTVVPVLLQLMKDKDGKYRHVAAQLLERLGPEAKEVVPSLIAALSDRRLRLSAAHALGGIGPEAKAAVPALTGVLKDDEGMMRIRAAQAILRMTTTHAEARATLDAAVKEPTLKVEAESALKNSSPPLTDAEILKLLNAHKEKAYDKKRIVLYLLKRGVRDRQMVPALIHLLVRERLDDKNPAIPGLMAIGAPAVPALLNALKDKNLLGEDRNRVVLALAAIDTSPRIVALLSDGLKDRKDDFNDHPVGLIRALAEIGPEAKEAVPLLLEILRRKKGDRTSWPNEAAKALGEIAAGDKKVLAALTETLKDEFTVVEALRGLVLLGPSSVPTLLDALRNKDYPYRNYVVDSLGELGKAALPALIEAIKDNDLTVRVDVINTLGRMGADAKPAVQALIDISKKDTTSFFAVNGALKQIDPEAWKKAGFK